MTKFQKAVALSLVLALVVFAAAACGVPDEEEFEEMDDDFGYQLEVEESFAEVDFDIETASPVNVVL
ncbi:hypothetical protein I0Q91_12475 [Halanaerobiaceae bacterium Z-7014]|uniref:Uncharacterized protein n=1 Tax=Halonatronomonas betaini TaxID=2778430 RepID=A0A931AS06_9FIRM|nr:hypothetical protein [Halonatronomonas betaini]MBF8437902.1 hypothetical protein [Halonatronomonas betaini]